MIKIKIAATPPSNNMQQGSGGVKKALEYNRTKKLWNEWIWIMRSKLKQRGDLDGLLLPYQKATVIMKYNFKDKRRRDPDNFSGKMILDGLKDNGFIVDDSFNDVDIFPLATFGNQEESTEITILEGHRIREIVELMRGGDIHE